MDATPAQKPEELENQITSLVAIRTGLVSAARRLRWRLAELRSETRAITSNIQADRLLLRNQIEHFRSLRETRRQTLDHLADVREELRHVREGFRRFDADLRRSGGPAAQETLQRLEWRLQTARLTREEEKDLVEQVRQLERKLLLWKKAYGEREKLNRLAETVAKLRTRLEELDVVREEAEPRLQELKARVGALQARRQQVYEEAGSLEHDLTELSTRIGVTDAELVNFRAQRRELLSAQRAADLESRLAREQRAIKDAQEVARAKLRGGQKLTFDELKVLLAEDEPELLK